MALPKRRLWNILLFLLKLISRLINFSGEVLLLRNTPLYRSVSRFMSYVFILVLSLPAIWAVRFTYEFWAYSSFWAHWNQYDKNVTWFAIFFPLSIFGSPLLNIPLIPVACIISYKAVKSHIKKMGSDN